jgi:hypothetical protein
MYIQGRLQSRAQCHKLIVLANQSSQGLKEGHLQTDPLAAAGQTDPGAVVFHMLVAVLIHGEINPQLHC